MWNNYSADSTGYCIEYDLSDYELAKNVLPVIYQDERKTNIIIQLVGSLIGQMIIGFNNGQIQADSSHFIRLFLTKYKKWEYQKEWRFLECANEKPKSSKIRTIYLGKNFTAENEKRIREYAYLNNIVIKKLD